MERSWSFLWKGCKYVRSPGKEGVRCSSIRVRSSFLSLSALVLNDLRFVCLQATSIWCNNISCKGTLCCLWQRQFGAQKKTAKNGNTNAHIKIWLLSSVVATTQQNEAPQNVWFAVTPRSIAVLESESPVCTPHTRAHVTTNTRASQLILCY